jgi:hypothetical protein
MKSAAQTAASQGNAGHECMRTFDRVLHASTYRPARTPTPRFGHPPLLTPFRLRLGTARPLVPRETSLFEKTGGTHMSSKLRHNLFPW